MTVCCRDTSFLRRGATRPLPVVLCVVGQGHYKEEHLHRVPSYALERGLSLLLVDLPGQSYSQEMIGSPCRYEVETAISGWVDFLADRSDIDQERIAIFGDGLGAAFATRGANLDDRFAAAVCDAGIWELHERAFIASRISGRAGLGCPSEIEGFNSSSVAANIKCPVLVAMGERDWLDVDHVTECCRVMKQNGLDIELKIFRASETVALARPDRYSDRGQRVHLRLDCRSSATHGRSRGRGCGRLTRRSPGDV